MATKWGLLTFLIVLAIGISGCAGGLGYQGMTPEQIVAAGKDKAAGIMCVSGKYAGASVNTLAINADKGIPVNITIDTDCKATFLAPAPVPVSSGVGVPVTITPQVSVGPPTVK
jgi:hypothetical protein